MNYSVEIPQLGALQRAFKQSPELVAKEVIKAGNRSLVRYQSTARQRAPIDRGQLRSSIQVSPMAHRGRTIEGSVGTNVKHAIWMEEGTGIYGPAKRPIRPKRAKALFFEGRDGVVYTRRTVKGSKPHWYMRTSVERNQRATVRDFGTALDNVTVEIARQS